MKLIGITTPGLWVGEAEAITRQLDIMLDRVHIRKPQATEAEVEQLLCRIPERYYPRLVLHNQPLLAMKYPLRGIHLNQHCPTAPLDYKGFLTRSCHTLEELRDVSSYEYVFLSPIYDSISKPGYVAAFPFDVLEEAHRKGLINDRVIALGGVTPAHLSALDALGFGGAAMMGYLWQEKAYCEFHGYRLE